MRDSEDLYEILQVHPSAEPDVIQAAYRRLALKYHPDRNQSPEAAEVMRRLNHAYGILRDPSQRAEYDRRTVEGSGWGASGAGQQTGSDESDWQYWQEHRGNRIDSVLVRRLRSIFLGAVGSVWGFLLLAVSLIAAVSFVSFIWWIADVLYAFGWWPLGLILRIMTWLMIAAVALRIVFLGWIGVLAIGRLGWRISALIVKPRVPASVGAVVVVLIVVIAVGAGIYAQFNPESVDNQEIELSSDGRGSVSEPQIQVTPTPGIWERFRAPGAGQASEPQIQVTPTPRPTPALNPTQNLRGVYWDTEGNIVTPALLNTPTPPPTPRPTAIPTRRPTATPSTLLAPQVRWVEHENAELGYLVTLPSNWTVEQPNEYDISVTSPDDLSRLLIYPFNGTGYTLDTIATDVIEFRRNEAEFELMSRAAVTLPSGLIARRIEYRARSSQEDCLSRYFEILVLRQPVAYELIGAVCEQYLDQYSPDLNLMLSSFTIAR